MDKFLESVRLAWNPIGEVRKRCSDGTLSFGSVLVPYVGVVIACNLFALAAQRFLLECFASQLGAQLPDVPLLRNDWAQKFASAFGVLAPVGVISLLPSRVFHPASRNGVAASALIVAAASSFYGAVLTAPIYFFSGILVSADPQFGLTVFTLLIYPSSIALIVLVLVFWLRITLKVLEIRFSQVVLISFVGLLVIGAMAALVMAAVNRMPDGNY